MITYWLAKGEPKGYRTFVIACTHGSLAKAGFPEKASWCAGGHVYVFCWEGVEKGGCSSYLVTSFGFSMLLWGMNHRINGRPIERAKASSCSNAWESQLPLKTQLQKAAPCCRRISGELRCN